MSLSFDILSYQALILARVEETVPELIGFRDCVYAKRALFRLSPRRFVPGSGSGKGLVSFIGAH